VAVVKRDYYEVLGVSTDADEEEIRSAFHALARDWHPDVTDAPDAEERFRELAEAYSVLSKREVRVLYDRYGYRGRGNQAVDETPGQAEPEPIRGENVYLDIELRSFEAEAGARPVVTYRAASRCTACMGRGTLGLADPASLAEPCERCDGTGTVDVERRIRLRIPPRVEDGAQLRVSGDGNDAGAGSVPGDLLVSVHVQPPPRDPRVVRYVASVLLLVAIATLLVYIVR
jgi:molecular chaperone DnaJ